MNICISDTLQTLSTPFIIYHQHNNHAIMHRVSMVVSTRRPESVSTRECEVSTREEQAANEGSTRGRQLFTTIHPLKCHQGISAQKELLIENDHNVLFQSGPLTDPWFGFCNDAESARSATKWRWTCPCIISRPGKLIGIFVVSVVFP